MPSHGAKKTAEKNRKMMQRRSNVHAIDMNGNSHRAHLRRVAKHAQNDRKKYRRVELRSLLVLLPLDAPLWVFGVWNAVPFVRLTRCIYALPRVLKLFSNFERSQAVPFALARTVNVMFGFCTIAHWLGCTFFFLTVPKDAVYFSEAPWAMSTVRSHGMTDVRCSLHLKPWPCAQNADRASPSRRTRCQAETHTSAVCTGASRPSQPQATPTSSMSRPTLRGSGRS